MDITLALAILLAAGFFMAKVGQLFRLPSVTGYICAGFLLGPAGFNLISKDIMANQLGHFSQIALMLIALGIGEHLEIKQLRKNSKLLTAFSLGEIIGTLFWVICGLLLINHFFSLGNLDLPRVDIIVLTLLLGTVSVATAPGSTLHVMRETRAVGPLTTTLLQTVAINNGMALILFGFARAIARNLAGTTAGSFTGAVTHSLLVIFLSLAIGITTGLVIDALMHRLRNRAEMLIGGLALLLLGGELARMLDLSPLLVGMAVGFTIVNRDRRDVRLFRVFNTFEPPIYVLFFTLAGAHLDFDSLLVAGWLGLIYFLLRVIGKISGAALGGFLAQAPPLLRTYLGPALVPQAGIAIGLVFLINSDPIIGIYGKILTPTVLAGVFLAELVGPASTKFALQKAKETTEDFTDQTGSIEESLNEVQLMPWTWEKLHPTLPPSGSVIFGASHYKTVAGLARLATLLAHHHKSAPLAVSINRPGQVPHPGKDAINISPLFDLAGKEVGTLGYQLQAVTIEAETVADGLVECARRHNGMALILGYPLQHSAQEFKKVLEEVVNSAPCPVILVRLAGILHTERILVPIIHSRQLETIAAPLCALATVGQHRISLLRLLPPDAQPEIIIEQEKKLQTWAAANNLPFVRCLAVATEARMETILEESTQHDLILMPGAEEYTLQKKLFGSLADDVANKCLRPMLIIYGSAVNSKKNGWQNP
ncbi:MAG: cation:proton antiporter [Proteobacteria bacterium]|nr:cation:proton antiporter [Pseudomonadota bacterium]MBU1715617.1 cation:proton antiporter [Pseudomonadota bacterium]